MCDVICKTIQTEFLAKSEDLILIQESQLHIFGPFGL